MRKSIPAAVLSLALVPMMIGCGTGGGSRTSLPASLDNARTLTQEWIERDPVMFWSWGEFVLLYGFWKLHEITGDAAVPAYVSNFLDENLYFYTPIASDFFSPATLVLLSCAETGAGDYCGLPDEFDDYFAAVKREEGAIVHLTGVPGQDRQVWVDSLFMDGAYLIERGRETGDPGWYAEAASQFVRFDRILSDPATGLLNHGFDFATGRMMNDPGVFWARGNAWYLASLGNLLTVLPPDHPDRAGLEALWRKRVESILPRQNEDGSWNTLLLEIAGNYAETSATALFAFGLATGLEAGLTDAGAREAVFQALDYLNGIIYESGGRHFLPDTSGGTSPGTAEYYLSIPRVINQNYGIGAYILAAIETARLRGEIE